MTRIRSALALAFLPTLSLALAACAGTGRPAGPRLKPAANPGAVIAADLAFAKLAREKGQWTAFRETATADAELFVPQRTKAAAWLKDRADPATSVRWQPHAAWSSCDGMIAVTRGQWQSANAQGGYATVWARQADGNYKWLLDMSLTSAGDAAAPEMIAAKVADCTGGNLPVSSGFALQAGMDAKIGVSPDGSLAWTSSVRADGARRFVLVMRQDGAPREQADLSSPPEPLR